MPSDLTEGTRLLWALEACPFINKACTKHNHDKTITYGTCSVTSTIGDVIICPNRLYANDYRTIKHVVVDAFGANIDFYLFDEFIRERENIKECIVALSHHSGKEVKVGNSLSMDWVLVRIENHKLVEYVGIEIQSIDITGNYRDVWHAYKNFTIDTDIEKIPSSAHGLNWANVHKRLIPQLIRKGLVYSRSKFVQKGLYFIVPELVYQRFEATIGDDIPIIESPQSDSITVYTYSLGYPVSEGEQRDLVLVRTIRFLLEDFANRFISGPHLPSGEELDNIILKTLGLSSE